MGSLSVILLLVISVLAGGTGVYDGLTLYNTIQGTQTDRTVLVDILDLMNVIGYWGPCP
jgi:hypothetical protein